MQIEIKIDPSCTEPKIVVVAESMSEEVQNLVKRLSVDVPQVISGIRDERLEVLEEDVLIRIYAGAGSVIWEIEQWSIARQTGTYFLAAMMPVAYFSYWMEHSVRGFLIYFCIFTVIFIVIWLVQYMFMRRDVNNINAKLK